METNASQSTALWLILYCLGILMAIQAVRFGAATRLCLFPRAIDPGLVNLRLSLLLSRPVLLPASHEDPLAAATACAVPGEAAGGSGGAKVEISQARPGVQAAHHGSAPPRPQSPLPPGEVLAPTPTAGAGRAAYGMEEAPVEGSQGREVAADD
ncbi:hypothetical protein PpBr36_02735 [Pyricularia pennisetigena]|uniref:hypothetical protein n=1 Tax=Pyricularia pennisetigena TaxID=1578925 RepID=UPI00115478AD|nr:hypothetical protein PpBr36_02735 [Pyricularia pennisetigena]TLS30614.1 hypothetical protein PpBr36_02735 [Pyricularia pennisetigena]